MALAVNLIKNRHSLSEKDYKREREVFRYSMVGLVIVVVITLAVSIWQFVLTTELNKVEVSITNSTKELQELSEANAMQVYLKSRLKLITSFLDDRSVSREALQRVFSLDIPGVDVVGASFESDTTISVQAKANDVISFERLIEYVSNENDFFIQVVSQNVTRSEDGAYQMDILLTIPKS